MSNQKFAESIGVPMRTFWTILQNAGLTGKSVEHTAKTISEHIAKFQNSEMTRTDYAKSIHVDRTTFLGWLEEAGVEVDGRGITPKRHLEIAQTVQEFECSGMSQEAFARQKGIPSRTFCGWLKRTKSRANVGISDQPAKA